MIKEKRLNQFALEVLSNAAATTIEINTAYPTSAFTSHCNFKVSTLTDNNTALKIRKLFAVSMETPTLMYRELNKDTSILIMDKFVCALYFNDSGRFKISDPIKIIKEIQMQKKATNRFQHLFDSVVKQELEMKKRKAADNELKSMLVAKQKSAEI